MNKHRFGLKAFASGAALAFLSACASTPSVPEQTLEERSQARWDHLIEGEAEQAREFYTPGFRAITSVVDYTIWVRNRPIQWMGAEVIDSWCESEDKCAVTVNIRYRVPGGPTGINTMRLSREIEEEWIRVDNEWFYVQN